jgi:hypothetical protein
MVNDSQVLPINWLIRAGKPEQSLRTVKFKIYFWPSITIFSSLAVATKSKILYIIELGELVELITLFILRREEITG